jgi:predicted  nucleic acid-binding Zn-ribbon protein
MKPIVEKLLELQTILLTKPAEGTEAAAKAIELRCEVPSSLLGHFQRQIARGRHAVAVVRNGVCGECHMRLPTSTAASLVSASDLVLCETCSCYLMLASDELETRRREADEAKQRRLKKIRQAASALV